MKLEACTQCFVVLLCCVCEGFSQLTIYYGLYIRSRVAFSSTAAERHSTGADCHSDDGDDDHSRSVMHVRMLEMRANKLEEQVQDLNVSNYDYTFINDLLLNRSDRRDRYIKHFGITL